MALFRKILVAVNGSGPSLEALREGCRLGRAERARLMAVTVAPPYEGDLSLVGVKNLQRVMDKPCHEGFAASERVAQEEGMVAEHLSTTGDISERLVEVAAEHACDLIVMGYRRRPALWRLLVGSVVPGVIAASPCEVLIVPQDSHFGWKRFLVVLHDPESAPRTAERALDFARAYGAELLIAIAPAGPGSRVAPTADTGGHGLPAWASAGLLDHLLQTAENDNVRVQTRTLGRRSLAAAIQLAGHEHADLTVLGQSVFGSPLAFLFDRVTALVMQRFACPILAVP